MVAEFCAIRRIQAGKTPSRSIWINFVLANLLSAGVGAGLLFIPGFPTGYGYGPDIMAPHYQQICRPVRPIHQGANHE